MGGRLVYFFSLKEVREGIMYKIILFFIFTFIFSNSYAEIDGSFVKFEENSIVNKFSFTDRATKTLATGEKAYLFKNKDGHLIEIILDKKDKIRKQTLITHTKKAGTKIELVAPALITEFVKEVSRGLIDSQQFDLMLNTGINEGKEQKQLLGFNVEVTFSKLWGEYEGMGLLTISISRTSNDQKDVQIEFPELRLEGIMYDKINPCAIVNGKIVKVGDEIKSTKVLEITEDTVKFKYEGGIFTKKLGVSSFGEGKETGKVIESFQSRGEGSERCQVHYEYGYNAGYEGGIEERENGYACAPEEYYNLPLIQITLKAIKEQVKKEGLYINESEFNKCFKEGFLDGYRDGYYSRSKKKMQYKW